MDIPRMAAQWQPIESAPRDGTPILLAVDWDDLRYVGWWRDNDGSGERCWRVQWNGDRPEDIDTNWTPSHWMPIPAPPVTP